MKQMEMVKDYPDKQKRDEDSCSLFLWTISSSTISLRWTNIDPTWDESHRQAGAAHLGWGTTSEKDYRKPW